MKAMVLGTGLFAMNRTVGFTHRFECQCVFVIRFTCYLKQV
jgi:hypothetical protein